MINLFTADFARKDEEQSLSVTAKQRRLPWLRDVIVRLQKPSFQDISGTSLFHSNNIEIPGCHATTLSLEFEALNPDQKLAVQKVMTANDYTLIQGLPGTGKTSTIAFIARLLAAHGKRILITSYTHSAVDNVLMKLMEKGVADYDATIGLPRLIRVGQKASCHDKVHPLLVSELATEMDSLRMSQSQLSQSERSYDNPSPESLKHVISSGQIIGASALSVPRSPLLADENFDVVIVDEAGQISQPAILGALMAADSFVLVGDHKQLPPLVNSEVAEGGGEYDNPDLYILPDRISH